MNVSPFKSIAAKIFYAMTAMLLLVIGVITWRNQDTFQTFLMNQIREDILSQAKESGEGIRNKVQSYTGLLALVMHSNAGRQVKEQQAGYDAFVNFNKDFVMFESFTETIGADAKPSWKPELHAITFDTKSPQFGLQPPQRTFELLRAKSIEFVNSDFNPKNQVSIRSFSPETKVPTVTMFVLFSTKDNQRKIAALTLWQHAISSYLPDSGEIEGFLVATNQALISASKVKSVFAGKTNLPQTYLSTAFSGQSRQGLLELRDQRTILEKLKQLYGESQPIMAGSYYHLPSLDAAVIIQRNVAPLYDTVVRLIVKSLLHAWLFLLLSMMLSFVTAEGISRRIRRTIEATKKIAVGDFSVRIIPDSKDEVAVLAESVNSMTVRIQNLLIESVEKVKLQDELHTAEIVQQRFLPNGELNIRDLRVHHYYQAANFCSGDWWGHFSLGDGIEMICIADVVGHGVASALVTAMTHSYLATVAHRARASGVVPRPAAILREFNDVLNGTMHGFMTATCFIAIFDLNEGRLVYSNAGHNFPYLLSYGSEDPSSPIKPKTLNTSGTPVGVVPDGLFKEAKLPINPGDRLVLYTDGLIECKSPELAQWGKSNFTKSLTRHARLDAGILLQNIVGEANTHFNGQPQDDDITVVVIEVSPDWMVGRNVA